MNNKEKLEVWKKKLAELEEKASKLDSDKDILVNSLDEYKANKNFKLNRLLEDSDIKEEISHLKDLARFDKEKIESYKDKIEKLGKDVSEEAISKIKEEVKLEKLAKPIEVKEQIKENIVEKKAEIKEKAPGLEIKKPPVKEEKPAVMVPANLPIKTEETEKENIIEKDLDDLYKDFEETKNKYQEIQDNKFEIPSEEELKEEVEKTRLQIEDKERELFKFKELISKNKKVKPPINAEEEKVKLHVSELFRKQEQIKKPFKIQDKLRIFKKPLDNIFENSSRLYNNKIFRYAVPFVILLFVAGILFVSQPEITGHVTLTEEKTYDDKLNLVFNESGNYTWDPVKDGDIMSIKADGRFKGNGTVKVYIEKDGERYLIYSNKADNTG